MNKYKKNSIKYINITLIFFLALLGAVFFLPPPQNSNAACNPPDDDCDGGCSCENLILEAPSPFCEPATNVGNVVWDLKSEGSLSDPPLILDIICLGGGSPEYGDGISWNIAGEFSFIISTNTYCEPGTAQFYVRITKPGKYRVIATIDETCIKTQYIHAAWVDLDIDSDHTPDFGGPERTPFEDEIEASGPSPHEALKYVVVNDYYEVDDWMPGYANFEMTPPYGSTNTIIFVPVVLEFDPCGLEVEDDQVNVNFTYTQSDPEDVPDSLTTQDDESVYPVPSGRLRIWTKNQPESRNPASIISDGDFIPTGVPIPMTKLGLPGEVTLYLEGINPTTVLGVEQIKVEITDSGLIGCPLEDLIHCTPIKIDVDTNNDDGFLPPEQNLAEDHYEDIGNDANRPGKILCVNDNDDDSDGIPDFADGYNWDYHVLGTDFSTSDNTNILENFVPIIFKIPEPIEISTAKIRISGDYEDSDPLAVTYDSQNGYELPASGCLRIWNCDDPTAERIPLGILDSGNIVTKGIYTAAEFGFTSSKREIKCYVEAIQPSQAIADYRILFEVDPDGDTRTSPNFIATDAVRMTILKVEFIKASASVAYNSPQQFEGHQTDFGIPCDPADPGQALVIFHKDARDSDFVVQDFDVDIHSEVLPSTILDSELSESWMKTASPDSGALNKTDTFDVKYQNSKEGSLYQFEFDLGLNCCAKSGASLLLPLGGPDVTAYYLSEAQRYDTWLATMKARVHTQTTSDFASGFIIISYFIKTVNHMKHRDGTYETEKSPCKTFCDNTVTISGYVFGKDQIGNFVFSYLAARTGFTFGTTQVGAQMAATLQSLVDYPDDQAAYEAGYEHGLNPSGNFQTILESKDINAMQNETAKKGWPSSETATGTNDPTWGATQGGLDNPD